MTNIQYAGGVVATQDESVKGRPALKISPDRTKLTVHFPPTSTVPPVAVVMECTTSQIDSLLRDLASVRAKMANEHPLQLRELHGMPGIVNPACRVAVDENTGETVISLRHPGLGWLHFVFSNDRAAELGRVIQAQAMGADSVKH